MAGGNYAIGLTATPNLFGNIYAGKQARYDADEAEKKRKDGETLSKYADKFRLDYSKIHPYHADQARLIVGKALSKASELQKELPHTFQNTEEFNRTMFDATAGLEDLMQSSKNIYGDFQRRADKPMDFKSKQELVEAINKNDHEAVKKILGGKDYFDAGDITSPIYKESEDIDFFNINKAASKQTDPATVVKVGNGTNDYLVTESEVIDKNHLRELAQARYMENPAAQEKYPDINDYFKFAEKAVAPKSEQLLRGLPALDKGNGVSTDINTITNNGKGSVINIKKGDEQFKTKSVVNVPSLPHKLSVSSGDGVLESGGDQLPAGQYEVLTGSPQGLPVAIKDVKSNARGIKGISIIYKPGEILSEEDANDPKNAGLFEYKLKVPTTYEYKEKEKGILGKEVAKKKTIYVDYDLIGAALLDAKSDKNDKAQFKADIEAAKAEIENLNSSKQSSKQQKTLSTGRVVYSDDGGKTWHP